MWSRTKSGVRGDWLETLKPGIEGWSALFRGDSPIQRDFLAAVIRERAVVSMTGFSSCNLYINACHPTLIIHKVLIINTFICKFNILYQIVAILRDNIVVLIRFQEFFLLMNSPLSCEELLDTF